jgi:adenine-specific DNA-methyltransferase
MHLRGRVAICGPKKLLVIKYLGSKRTLLTVIARAVQACPEVRTVIDLFSGTARVGHMLKRAGYRVLANDHNAYAHVLATCYVQADRQEVLDDATRLVQECNCLSGIDGWFTQTYCERSRFFQPRNGRRIDAIREHLAHLSLPRELEAVLLVSLMEAADRVDSTTGVQMAYLKSWAPRAHQDLQLRIPDLLPRASGGKARATALDALEAAAVLEADLAYLDPPYNQHAYLNNYHIWESLVRWDKPEVYGVACKRIDCRARRSEFNSRPRCAAALAALIDAISAPIIVLSFSNEGYLRPEQIETMLARRGAVVKIANSYRRYVGAQIGIFNPKGEKVGKVSHLHNTEYLYVAGPKPVVARVAAEFGQHVRRRAFLSKHSQVGAGCGIRPPSAIQ